MKNIGDLDLARIDSSPQDKPGQVLDDHANNKSYQYVLNGGVAAGVLNEAAVRTIDGVVGSVTSEATTDMLDTVNAQAVLAGVWLSAVPAGQWGWIQSKGRVEAPEGTIPAAGLPISVASGAFVFTVTLAGEPNNGYSADGTAIFLT